MLLNLNEIMMKTQDYTIRKMETKLSKLMVNDKFTLIDKNEKFKFLGTALNLFDLTQLYLFMHEPTNKLFTSKDKDVIHFYTSRSSLAL